MADRKRSSDASSASDGSVAKRIPPRDPRSYGPNKSNGGYRPPPKVEVKPEPKEVRPDSKPGPRSAATNEPSTSTAPVQAVKKPATVSGLRVEFSLLKYDGRISIMRRVYDWIGTLKTTTNSCKAIGDFFRIYYGIHGKIVIKAICEAIVRFTDPEKMLSIFYVVDVMLKREEEDAYQNNNENLNLLMKDIITYLPAILFHAGMFMDPEKFPDFCKLLNLWQNNGWFFTSTVVRYFCNCYDEGNFFREQIQKHGRAVRYVNIPKDKLAEYRKFKLDFVEEGLSEFAENKDSEIEDWKQIAFEKIVSLASTNRCIEKNPKLLEEAALCYDDLPSLNRFLRSNFDTLTVKDFLKISHPILATAKSKFVNEHIILSIIRHFVYLDRRIC